MYLTSIMDLSSRKTDSLETNKNNGSEEVFKMSGRSKKGRKTDNPVVIHSEEVSIHIKKIL